MSTDLANKTYDLQMRVRHHQPTQGSQEEVNWVALALINLGMALAGLGDRLYTPGHQFVEIPFGDDYQVLSREDR